MAMTDPWQAKAERLLGDLEKDHPQKFFHALRSLIDERFPRGRGRPGGKDSRPPDLPLVTS